jgi:N-hydroxyarylamine O-acetyltransferase
MTASPAEIHAYCERIGCSGPMQSSLRTLQQLIGLHVASIPFENIDVLLGVGVDISPASVHAKLVERRRGGYCFEHNGLFARMLAAFGFTVEGLSARVLWQAPTSAPARARTHMALRVLVDGEPWLVDVGFGGMVPTSPLRLTTADAQSTTHGPFRVTAAGQGPGGQDALIEAWVEGSWHPLYEVQLQAQQAVDFEPLNWFTSTHPDSVFRHALMAARTTPDARYTLRNDRLSTRWHDGRLETRKLDLEALAAALEDVFGLAVAPEWRPLLARFAPAAP